MYASFKPDGGTAVALSDSNKVREDMVMLQDSSDKQVDVARPLRAGFSRTLDRGNQLTQLRWRTTKQFASTDAGYAWLQTTRVAVSCVGLANPWGVLTLTIRNSDMSTKAATVDNANVKIKLTHGERDGTGCCFCFEFECEGGEMSAFA